MNAMTLAQRAYAPPSAATETPREIEHRALARVTAKLRALRDDDGPGAAARKAEALNENARLWAIFGDDCGSPTNPLPLELRRGIVKLAAFSLVHMRRVLAGEADVEPLIEVNVAVMRGLRGQASVAA
jgi:flagellar protein FlaF